MRLIFLCMQPVEFCSDVFLLPLGSPPLDTLDLIEGDYQPLSSPNNPPPLDPAIYEYLIQSLDNNNRQPPPIKRSNVPTKHSKINPLYETFQDVEHYI